MSDYNRNEQNFRTNGGENTTWPQDASFLSDAPARLGEQMQQGGVPLFGNGEFAGDDAPTRIGRPVLNQQMAAKRTSLLAPLLLPGAGMVGMKGTVSKSSVGVPMVWVKPRLVPTYCVHQSGEAEQSTVTSPAAWWARRRSSTSG